MNGNVVDRATWTEARLSLLDEEKALQRARDRLAERRRALPRVRIDETYEFDTPDGRESLAGLFGERSQLVVYHFMFHPDWGAGCKSCSFWADSFDRMRPHLAARDVRLVVVSRAPLEKLQRYQQRMGWRFRWVSSAGSRFNADFQASFSSAELSAGSGYYNYRKNPDIGEEMPGFSVFQKDADGSIYHTYSTYSRGLDPFNPVYQLLDIVPKGRDEQDFDMPMAWVRRHDEYGKDGDEP